MQMDESNRQITYKDESDQQITYKDEADQQITCKSDNSLEKTSDYATEKVSAYAIGKESDQKIKIVPIPVEMGYLEPEVLDEKERAFKLVVTAGQILLENGAEIARVEETMDHMGASLGVEKLANYVIANGIFLTAEGTDSPLRSTIKQAAPGNTNLRKIEEINALSRDMERNAYTLEEVEERMEKIQNMTTYSWSILLVAYVLGAGCFCYALGGSFRDSLVAAVAGFCLGIFFMITEGRLNAKALKIMLGGVIATSVCMIAQKFGFGDSLERMIVGSLIPMIPGVPFTNSIRDFVENDYLSGLIRMMDVLLVMISMAIGVALVYQLPTL